MKKLSFFSKSKHKIYHKNPENSEINLEILTLPLPAAVFSSTCMH